MPSLDPTSWSSRFSSVSVVVLSLPIKTSFFCMGGIDVGGPPILSSLMKSSFDAYRALVDLTLYPLHRMLWFNALLNVKMDGYMQYAVCLPYSVFTLVRFTMTMKLCRTRNPHHMLQC